ncbi:MAG TPA: pyruvate kinase, partial [Longimicrobiales bacterium]|nr:pyruvate kinase [Longimicrobiales bacterium]
MTRTKVVCTLGPASSSPDVIRQMVDAGMSMARINMSHGTRESHRTAIERVRAAAEDAGRSVPVLVDLAGPKIRVGELDAPIPLEVGQRVVLAPSETAGEGMIPTTYEHLAEDLEPGDPIMLDDGLLELRTVETSGDRVTADVVKGGPLKSRKGINIPSAEVRAPSLTEKDLEDLDFALDVGAEYISLSFVRRPSDVADLRERVGGRALVVAKIEKAQALAAIEEILEVADAVMVARGDLGVELPFERVPMAQKRIIQLSNYYARPVITATQMLESMIESPRPTRAEASDVANAILDGTDAVMLSGETAVGDFPVQAVEAMVRIASELESSGALASGPAYDAGIANGGRRGATLREHAIASASVSASEQLSSPALIVITRSGFSARLLSSYRPNIPIFAVTTDPRTVRQLSTVWGVEPHLAVEEELNYEALTEFGKRRVLASGIGKDGDAVVVTAGYPFHTS